MLETTALRLLLKVAQGETKETSTVALAEEVGVSQQSVSRVLTELCAEQLVTKRPLLKGLQILLTPKGRLALLNLRGKLSTALHEERPLLQGVVTKGVGEGKYYLSIVGYKKPLARLLGADPYPGTLNVKVEPEKRELFLAGLQESFIHGFETGERSYGPVKFYKVRVADRECGLIMPVRTSHGPDLVELVDTVHLRATLHLKDGDQVTIEPQ